MIDVIGYYMAFIIAIIGISATGVGIIYNAKDGTIAEFLLCFVYLVICIMVLFVAMIALGWIC